MKVHVIFEFAEITQIDSEQADHIVEDITNETVALAKEYGAKVWVDDVTVE